MAYNNRLTHIIGGNTAGVTARIVSGTYQLAGGSNISLSQNGNTVSIIGLSALNANGALSGSNGSFTFQTATFGNLNGMSFYTSNGSLVGSYTVPSTAGLISAINLSAGSTSNNLTAVTFSNLNGVSFGLNGSVITGSHNGLTSQSNQAISAGNGSFAFQTVSFSNANGISFSTAGGSAIIASHNGLTTARASTDGVGLNTAQTNVTWTVNSSGISLNASGYAGIGTSATNASITLNSNGLAISVANPGGGSNTPALSGSNGSFTFSTATFGTLNGISFYTSNGSFVASHNGLTSQSNQAASASNGSFTFQTIGFSNANNVTFGTSAGSIVTASVIAQTNQTVGLYATGNTTQNSSTTLDARTISFNALGAMTAGFSNGSIQLSAPASSSLAAGANITISTAGSTITIIGGTASPSPIIFSAGTSSASISSVVFSNSNGVSFGLNGSTITASANAGGVNIAASNTTFTSGTVVLSNNGGALTISSGAQSVLFSVPQTSSFSATGQISISTNGSTISIGAPNPVTLSNYQPYPLNGQTQNAQIGNGTIQFFPLFETPAFSISRVNGFISMTISSSSNSSHAGAASFFLGLYTRTGSSLSLLTSASGGFQWTNTSSNSFNSLTGMKGFSIPLAYNNSYTADLYAGFMSLTSTTNANWFSMSNINLIGINGVTYQGLIGDASNTTRQMIYGAGVYTASSSQLPNSVAISQLNASNIFRIPYLNMVNYTA